MYFYRTNYTNAEMERHRKEQEKGENTDREKTKRSRRKLKKNYLFNLVEISHLLHLSLILYLVYFKEFYAIYQ